MGSPPRFFCDDHLGRLARWLRACGFDCAWENPIDDGVLLRRAADEDRVVLTKDTRLASGEIGPHLLVRSSDFREQLRAVLDAFDLDPLARAFTRCVACNGPLVEVDKASVREDVPPLSYAAFDRFWRCADCGRVLWRGSHVERTLRWIRRIVG